MIIITILLIMRAHLLLALCPNSCNFNGECTEFDICNCYEGFDGFPIYSGADCSLKSCPRGPSWLSEEAVKANDVHHVLECSNRGLCDRTTGLCACQSGYQGTACERTSCQADCSQNGICISELDFAENSGLTYSSPWDSLTQFGCLCDQGYRGIDCLQGNCISSSHKYIISITSIAYFVFKQWNVRQAPIR